MSFFIRNAVMVSGLMVLAGCEGLTRQSVIRQLQFGAYQGEDAAQTSDSPERSNFGSSESREVQPCESQEGDHVRLILALSSARLTSEAMVGRISWGAANKAQAGEKRFLSAYSECREARSRDQEQASAKLRSLIQKVLREAVRASDPIDIQFDSEIDRRYTLLLARVAEATQSDSQDHQEIEELLNRARTYLHGASESSIECRVRAKKNEPLDNCRPHAVDQDEESGPATQSGGRSTVRFPRS